MRLLISLFFITFCVFLLINEKNASYSPNKQPNIFLVRNHIVKTKSEEPVQSKVLDPVENLQDCHMAVPIKAPDIADIYPNDIDSQPIEPIENFEFDWAGFNRNDDHQVFEQKTMFDQLENGEKVEKRLNFHVTGDFDKDYLKHVHLYPPSCACQTKYRLFDLGHNTFPQYVLNAVCTNRRQDSRNCWLGSKCKEIPYIVRVLTQRDVENESVQDDENAYLLPLDLKKSWKFKSVKVSAACQCAL
uniref:CSON003333 protein n=2 Tax=Culicoides sonorensis TaxID=179676 RepID=A0A336K1K1_CULSO